MRLPLIPRLAALLFAGLLSTSVLAGAGEQGAKKVVQSLESHIVGVMKAGISLDFKGRFARLMPILLESYDLPYISTLVLRRHWPELSVAERALFTKKFSELTAAIYAGELGEFTGQEFAVTETRALRRGRMLVRSELRHADTVDQFDYVLHKDTEGNWRIVNVSVNGVSDLALKRSEYAVIFGDGGFSALIQRLDEKISNYRSSR